MAANSFTKWALSSILEAGDAYIFAPDLWEKYSNFCESTGETRLGNAQCGVLLSKLFPDIRIVKKQVARCIKRKYMGITWKNKPGIGENVTAPPDLTVIRKHMPEDFIELSRNGEESVQFSFNTGLISNGLCVNKVLTVIANGHWSVEIFGNKLLPNDLATDVDQVLTLSSITRLCDAVRRVRICQGFPCGSFPRTSANLKCVRFEEWGEAGELRCRSRQCSTVLSLLSTVDNCPKCRAGAYNNLYRKISESKEQEPVQTLPELELTDNCADLLDRLFPKATPQMKALILSQRQCLLDRDKDPRCRRWEKEIILLCLSIFNQSPHCYTFLRNSGFLILPSPSLLQRYKNVLHQRPGLHDDLIKWMWLNARERQATTVGGIIFDEMSIQDELYMVVRGNSAEYTGFVDMGSASESMRILSSQSNALLATHILQFVFLSFDGFRWPFAYFPTDGVKAADLFLLIWKAIGKLSLFGFHVEYLCMDGASSNRALVKLHPTNDFTCSSLYNPGHKLTFIMDYSHVIKRIRNNICSSGEGNRHTRLLEYSGFGITWESWILAYKWDRATNPVRIHPKLTDDHLFLTRTSKMRNHLAEDVLNADMLNLMEQYMAVLGPNGGVVQKCVDILKQTSSLVSIFRDTRPIRVLEDDRLQRLQQIESWFKDWERSTLQVFGTSVGKNKLMTQETREDLTCLLVGFGRICERNINANPPRLLVPAMINSDIVENMFCQQRATHHGANTNPNEFQYKKGITSIILGQNLISKKSNASPSTVAGSSAVPYTMVCHGPLQSSVKRQAQSSTETHVSSPKKLSLL